MEKIIQNVEKWKSYIPKDDNPHEIEYTSHRITTADGDVYACWRGDNEPELKSYSKYSMKETGTKQFSFFNEPKKNYTSVRVIEELPMNEKKVITDTPTLFDQESPVEPTRIIEKTSDAVYHQMALEYLWRIEVLNLPNLALLAPVMKDICEGKMDKNKLGKLHLELYPKMN